MSGLVGDLSLLGGGESCGIWKMEQQKNVVAVLSAREGLRISACDPMPNEVYRESQGANLNLVAERRCSWVGIANEPVEMGSCTEQESTVKRSETIAYTTERQWRIQQGALSASASRER